MTAVAYTLILQKLNQT